MGCFHLGKNRWKFEPSPGVLSTVMKTAYLVLNSLISSYSIAIVVVTLLMIVFFQDLKIGLLSMMPNLLPILATIGGMGVIGIQLDLFNILLASVVIGLVVDDTIHFIYGFQTYWNQAEHHEYALHSALQNTGRALMYTTLILTSGFMSVGISEWKNIANFGMLTAVCIVLALLADVFLAPALLVWVFRNKGQNAMA